ncbi:MAG TPA: TolC family protein, partial [Nitrospiraceae bacterium]|nr:TolC family protein [Nitrospiraceae bacterium]
TGVGGLLRPRGQAIQPGEILSVDRCVGIGLANHPSIRAGSHAVDAAASRVGQARSGYYPQITLSSGYSKYSLVTDPMNTDVDQYSASATLTQSVYEFGKTWNRVTIQQRFRDAAQADLRDITNQVVFSVKNAYYNVLQARRSVEVLVESVKSFEQHLEQARAFFETGVRSKFDVTKAEVDLSNARLILIRGENLLRVRQAVLNNAMGVADATETEYDIEDTLSIEKLTITLDDAVRKAYENRPDLLAVRAREEAAGESVTLARKGFLPALTGSATYTREAEQLPVDQTGWSVGLTLTFPLFSGFLTSYEVREAKENVNIARANEEGLRQAILLDVKSVFLSLREADERVAVAELTVRQAEENYEIARGRYEAGVSDIIEETDSLVGLRNAKLGLISALADYKIADAALKRAMGEQ